MSACLRSVSSALEVLRPMQGHSAPPATSTTQKLVAQPRKVRLSFRKRSTDVEKGAHHVWRFATTVSTLDSQLFHSRPRDSLSALETRDPATACVDSEASSSTVALGKALSMVATKRFIVCDPHASSFLILRSGTRDPHQSPSSTRAPSPGHSPRSCQPPSPTD